MLNMESTMLGYKWVHKGNLWFVSTIFMALFQEFANRNQRARTKSIAQPYLVSRNLKMILQVIGGHRKVIGDHEFPIPMIQFYEAIDLKGSKTKSWTGSSIPS